MPMIKLPVSKGKVCVVGDEYFTLGFTLGGASDRYVINVKTSDEEVFRTLDTMVKELRRREDITLIVVQESLKPYFNRIRQPLNKVIVYIPAITSASKAEVKEYYSSLIRRYLGIALELG